MNHRFRTYRHAFAWLGAAALLAATVAACGGGSGDASQLLRDTFRGSHTIKSGKVNFSLTLTPSGSKSLTSPVSLSFNGPFQSRGTGKLPQSNFNLSGTLQGHTGSLGIVSTGDAGFVTLQNTAYKLPDDTFRRLEASFANTGAGGANPLGNLGIDPLNWLTNPSVVGDEDVAGTPTTHIRAGINVKAFLTDLSKVLQKVAAQGAVPGGSTLANGLSPSTINRVASAAQNPSFDLWTGKSDKTFRRVQINLTYPVSGQISSLLGGLNSAAIGLVVEYDDLNQPQTIVAPTNPQPYAQFTAKLRSLVSQLRTALGGLTGGGGTSSLTPGSSSGTTTPSGAAGGAGSGAAGGAGSGAAGGAGNVQAYSQCIQQAGGDVSKMQACARLLNGP
jgi:hypothetical protein